MRLSAGNWLTLGIFLVAQTILAIGAVVGMNIRLSVLEERVSNATSSLTELKQELRQIKVANRE